MSIYEPPRIGMSASAVPCPTCHADIGDPCRTRITGRLTYSHVPRMNDWDTSCEHGATLNDACSEYGCERARPARQIWTAADFESGLESATLRRDKDALDTLWCHGLHVEHCGGYEVLAWPCPPAAKVLDHLFGGEANV